MNLKKMMQQAQRMQEEMLNTQAELGRKEVEATAGGGKVKVRANAAGEILSIKIDPSVVDATDVEMLEDLVLSGVKKALEDGKALASKEMSKVTAGLQLPPGVGF